MVIVVTSLMVIVTHLVFFSTQPSANALNVHMPLTICICHPVTSADFDFTPIPSVYLRLSHGIRATYKHEPGERCDPRGGLARHYCLVTAFCITPSTHKHARTQTIDLIDTNTPPKPAATYTSATHRHKRLSEDSYGCSLFTRLLHCFHSSQLKETSLLLVARLALLSLSLSVCVCVCLCARAHR